MKTTIFCAGSLLCALLSAYAQPYVPTLQDSQLISLPSTWGEYDLQQQTGYSPGLLMVANQSSKGFSATISSNGINPGVDSPAFPSKSQYLPRVYNFMPNQPITNSGQRVTIAFDLQFNTVADPLNTGSFRIAMGDTNCNNSWSPAFSIGTSFGTFFRYDSTATQDTNWFNPNSGFYLFMPPSQGNPQTNYSFGSFCDANGSSVGSVSGSVPPNAVNTGTDTTTVQHFRFSVERTPSGIQCNVAWGNSGGTNVVEEYFAPVLGGIGDDYNGGIVPTGTQPWTNVNVFGFCLFGTGANEHFFGFNPGTYTISNLKAYSGFYLTDFQRNPTNGNSTLTWESSRADVCSYIVQRSPDLTNWTSLSTNASGGYVTSYEDPAPAGNAQFYRVVKSF